MGICYIRSECVPCLTQEGPECQFCDDIYIVCDEVGLKKLPIFADYGMRMKVMDMSLVKNFITDPPIRNFTKMYPALYKVDIRFNPVCQFFTVDPNIQVTLTACG